MKDDVEGASFWPVSGIQIDCFDINLLMLETPLVGLQTYVLCVH